MVDWLTIYHLVLPFLQYQLQEPPNNLGSALDLFILRDTYGPNLFQGKGPSTIYNHLYISVSDNHPYEAFINSNLQPPKNSPKGLVDKKTKNNSLNHILYYFYINGDRSKSILRIPTFTTKSSKAATNPSAPGWSMSWHRDATRSPKPWGGRKKSDPFPLQIYIFLKKHLMIKWSMMYIDHIMIT